MQPTWHIERLLMRTDGFASVSVTWAGGEMVTKPLTFAGQELEINYRTGAAGSDVASLAGKPVPALSEAEAVGGVLVRDLMRDQLLDAETH